MNELEKDELKTEPDYLRKDYLEHFVPEDWIHCEKCGEHYPPQSRQHYCWL